MILSCQAKRKVNKNLELSYNNTLYQIQAVGQGHRLRQAWVKVCATMDGQVRLFWNTAPLKYHTFKRQTPAYEADDKTLTGIMDRLIQNAKSYPKTNSPKAAHAYKSGCRAVDLWITLNNIQDISNVHKTGHSHFALTNRTFEFCVDTIIILR
jgi:hypothetical protein